MIIKVAMSSPFRRLCHWGPLAVLAIIKLITWSMIHVIGMWWPPHASIGGALHAVLFLLLASGTLYYFLQSLLEGPGCVPQGWRPEDEADTEYLQFCTICNGYKAPRSHHCRKCGYCVKKMDHHCPWINCCVGHANHNYFTKFLIFAVFGCLHATIALSVCLYHGINRVWYMQHGTGREPLVYLSLGTLLLTLLSVGMAVGVVLAVGTLLYFQIRGILRNRTTIEDWIVEKAISRRQDQSLPLFVYPYDLGWKRNLDLVIFGEHYDGLRWPVLDGCDQYTLTREQLAQKAEKRVRARLYGAVAGYSARWLALCARPRAATAPPCAGEPRLPLAPGDRVRATRMRKYWMFGEKLVGDADGARGPRGWFPRDVVVPLDDLKHKPD